MPALLDAEGIGRTTIARETAGGHSAFARGAQNSATERSERDSVEIRGVTKRFGAVAALRDVSLCVKRGEFVSFLGPSGCGKTTLLRIIAGLETPTAGTVTIAGKDVCRDPPYLRDIGLVFQNYALFPHKTVSANVRFGLRYRTRLDAQKRERLIEQALDLVRLRDYGTRKPSQLSGGQQQRVALARAVATRPEVLLLDEPLSNLDAKLRDEMRVELKELHRALGMTFIYVTHDRAEALSMSDRVVVLRDGTIEQYGAPREIFERPRSIDVARFMGHTNLLPGTVRGYGDGVAAVELAGGVVVQALAPEFAPGAQSVWVLVRNNAVMLRPSQGDVGQTGGPAMSARIRSIFYQGLHVEVHVELPEGARLRVEVPSHQAEGLQADGPVSLGILTSGTWVLSRNAE